jgi:hypothetical protein
MYAKVDQCFRGTHHFHLQEQKTSQPRNSVKAGGKQSIWLAGISDYIRNRREMEGTTEQANGRHAQNNQPASESQSVLAVHSVLNESQHNLTFCLPLPSCSL